MKLAGEPRADSVCMTVQGPEQIRGALDALTTSWIWTDQEIKSMLIDGSKVAVRFELKATFAPTGEVFETEMMDEIQFNDAGEILSFIEFVDTAEAMRLTRTTTKSP